jgi:hypothetical protein
MEPSSPDALHPGESSESQAFYRSQVTLGLSSWQPVPRFARLTALLVGVFQKTPGAVKLTFSVAPGRRQFTRSQCVAGQCCCPGVFQES